jgi:tryptophanyl-tRNA synthetase
MSDKINENTSKSDISKEVKVYLDSKEFKTKIEKIVKDRLKDDKELEDKMVEISKNVITQLYKTLWTRRSFWRSNLSNKAS